MADFITADTHFSHKNIIDFEARPFADVDEMNEGLITAWNKAVGKTDTVYHLGDFCFGGRDKWFDILDRLKGNIVLIKGNHDKTKIVNRMMAEGLLTEVHPIGCLLKRDGMSLNLTHYPLYIGDRHRQFNLHGHIHGNTVGTSYNLNVGVDSVFAQAMTGNKPFGTPIELNALVEEIKRIENERFGDNE